MKTISQILTESCSNTELEKINLIWLKNIAKSKKNKAHNPVVNRVPIKTKSKIQCQQSNKN
jgi:hypothetical protein